MIVEGWKNSDDELPPIFTDVLMAVTYDHGTVVHQGFLMLGNQWVYAGSGLAAISHPVNHWMPLPAPPAGGSRGAKNRVIEDVGRLAVARNAPL